MSNMLNLFDDDFLGDDGNPFAEPAQKPSNPAAAQDEWAAFDEIITNPAKNKAAPKATPAPAPVAAAAPAAAPAQASPVQKPKHVRAVSTASSVGSPEPEKKLKCSVDGCKNRRLRKTFCALHLNSEYDTEREQEQKSVKSPLDWECIRSTQEPKSAKAYFNKNVITWKFMYKGERHTIILRHSPIGGKRVVLVDGEQVLSEKQTGSSRHPLTVGRSEATRVPCVIVIKQGITTEYDLEIKGGPFEDARDIWLNSEDF